MAEARKHSLAQLKLLAAAGRRVRAEEQLQALHLLSALGAQWHGGERTRREAGKSLKALESALQALIK